MGIKCMSSHLGIPVEKTKHMHVTAMLCAVHAQSGHVLHTQRVAMCCIQNVSMWCLLPRFQLQGGKALKPAVLHVRYGNGTTLHF